MNNFIKYSQELKNAIDSISYKKLGKLKNILHDIFVSHNNIFICGNGGSFANSCHIAEDFVKCIEDKSVYKPKVIALGSNPAQLTCLSNDYSYEDVFSYELERFAQSGDVLIGLSVSGTSNNVLKAFQVADDLGLTTISITGNKNLDNSIAELATIPIIIESADFGIVEDVSMHIFHNLVREFSL